MKANKSGKPEIVSEGNVTVRIYTVKPKNGASVYFQVADYTSGKRRLRSFTDRSEARAEARSIARRLASGQVDIQLMTPAEKSGFARAVDLLRPSGVPMEIAAACFAEAHALLGGNFILESARFFKERNPNTLIERDVAQVAAELVALKTTRGMSRAYLKGLRSHLARFGESFKVPISSVSGPDIQRWLDGLNHAPKTISNYGKSLSVLFSFARSRGYVAKGENILTDIETPPCHGGRIEIYSPGELRALLDAAPANFVPVVALGGFAGVRMAEITRLDWQAVNLESGFITIGKETAKTKTRRLTPISANLAAWLRPYAKPHGPIWPGTEKHLQEAREATAAKSGVPWKANGLRHSAISYRVAQTQDVAATALESGNSPAIIFSNYRQLVTPDDAKTWFAIFPKAKE